MWIHTPILTGNDGEGAGETFNVVVDPKNPSAFFNKKALLTVTGQLHVEAFALNYRNVYTFGPTFRADPSNTTRHASEFWMIEPEMAFCDLKQDMRVIEKCIKFAVKYVLAHAKDEIQFFNTWIDKNLVSRLEAMLTSKFKKLTYTKGIEILQEAVQKGHKFDNSKVFWGMDLASEHERYLSETYSQGPLFLMNYPAEIKAFYMRLNDDQKTVAACDLLVPGIGELVGGSQREERYDFLLKRMEKIHAVESLGWYLDLRKYGSVVHSGFGIGFDRLLMYVTGMTNIRDVQPFPRTPGSLKY
jgi:asparaginyl-tRNA synthetase